MAKTSKQGPTISAGLAMLWRNFREAFDPYQPELHYMRGPGPKWRAKHAHERTEAPDLAGHTPLAA